MKIPNIFATVNVKTVDPAIVKCVVDGCKNNAEAHNNISSVLRHAPITLHICDSCFKRLLRIPIIETKQTPSTTEQA